MSGIFSQHSADVQVRSCEMAVTLHVLDLHFTACCAVFIAACCQRFTECAWYRMTELVWTRRWRGWWWCWPVRVMRVRSSSRSGWTCWRLLAAMCWHDCHHDVRHTACLSVCSVSAYCSIVVGLVTAVFTVLWLLLIFVYCNYTVSLFFSFARTCFLVFLLYGHKPPGMQVSIIRCLSQTRVNWEGCSRKGILHKMWWWWRWGHW